MAFGFELVLGFPFEQFSKVSHLTKVDIQNRQWNNEDDFRDEVLDEFLHFSDALKVAHLLTLKKVGFYDVVEDARGFTAITPLGKRDFSPFHLQWKFDPYELEDQIKDSIIGISLSGRYVPTFLDWKSTHGTISNVAINKELLDMVKIARTEIVKVIPEFADAELIIREEHY
jgi:hypothetical protein